MTATAVVDAPKSGTAPRRARWNPAPRRTPYAFLVPAVLLFTAVFLVPLGYTVYLHPEDPGPGARPRPQRAQAGLHRIRQLRAVFHDSEFWHSILRACSMAAS